MRRFAQLLERLAFTPARNGKLKLLTDYLAADARSRSGLGIGRDHPRPHARHGEAGDACVRSRPSGWTASSSGSPTTSSAIWPRPIALIWPEPSDAPAERSCRCRTSSTGCAPPPGARGRAWWRQLLDRVDGSGRFAPPEARHRRPARRRLRPPRQAGAGRFRRTRGDGDRGALAWPRPRPTSSLFAWLTGAAPRPEPAGGRHAVPPGDARRTPLEEGRAAAARPGRLRRRMEVGRHPGAGGRRRVTAGGSTPAPETISPARFPTCSTPSTSTPRWTASCWSAARTARSRPSPTCSSG